MAQQQPMAEHAVAESPMVKQKQPLLKPILSLQSVSTAVWASREVEDAEEIESVRVNEERPVKFRGGSQPKPEKDSTKRNNILCFPVAVRL